MKNKFLIIIAILAIIGTVFFSYQGLKKDSSEYTKITAQKAKEIIDTQSDVVIIDVRTIEEFNSGHLEGAICIPNETIDELVISKLPDKQQELLVYCRSGNRSQQASMKLLELGYENVKDFGGIIDWPYEIIK